MANYLVTMSLIIGDDKPIYVTCFANESELKHLKKIDYHNEGGCCGQNICIECNGMEIRFHDSMKIKGSRQTRVAEFANSKGTFNLKYFLDLHVESSEEISEESSKESSEESSE